MDKVQNKVDSPLNIHRVFKKGVHSRETTAGMGDFTIHFFVLVSCAVLVYYLTDPENPLESSACHEF